MEIAVASTSPLGQYLAELDAEADEGASMAQLLSKPRPASTKKRPRRLSGQASRSWSWMQLIQLFRRRVELVAARRLISELCAFHPTIREELQQATMSDVVWSEGHRGWWTRHVAVLRAAEEAWGVIREVLMVVIAVAAAGGVFVLQIMWWVVALAAFMLLGMELSEKLLLAWYVRRSKRLVSALNGFTAGLDKFNVVYAGSLTLVKRAELASRGYRLGAGFLPPIGRLEASDTETGGDGDEIAVVSTAKRQLRCLPLRRKLRTLNGQLQTHASILVHEGEKTGEDTPDPLERGNAMDEQAPSLLLTALTKQHNRVVLLLENAVHTILMRDMVRAFSTRDSNVNRCLFRSLDSQRGAIEQLTNALSVWTDDLEAWNSTKDPVALFALDSREINFSKQQQKDYQVPSNLDDNRLKSVARQLQDLRSTSETLTALVIASQHELMLTSSVLERLTSSRDAMGSMMQQLQEVWGNYNNALSAVTDREEDMNDAEEVEEEECESKPISASVSSSVPAPEDPHCTVVFTGTSTGDEDFDLQALLKQQETDATASLAGPKPLFVRELQDVLAHREAHARPGLTRQVDHDPVVLWTPLLNAENAALSPPPPLIVDTMFALPCAPPRRRPRQPPLVSNALHGDSELSIGISASRGDTGPSVAANKAINLELEALLQRVQPIYLQEGVIECLGNSDEESEAEAELVGP